MPIGDVPQFVGDDAGHLVVVAGQFDQLIQNHDIAARQSKGIGPQRRGTEMQTMGRQVAPLSQDPVGVFGQFRPSRLAQARWRQ
ncbi:hypothetical protein SDC9_175930 [bioreactor metagenome]|uniref:Uncharacterized protein n=1 Tax=bioreactor metagenome TaxID=1076179 RepID=A0A645GNJ3_9ZZZZ